MMKLFTTTAIGLALCATGSAAIAGGLDRATFNSSLLYQTGTYAELSFAKTDPDVAPTTVAGGAVFSSGWEVASPFETAQFGFKTDINDKLSFALSLNSNPFGVDINYSAFASSVVPTVSGLSSLRANLSGKAITAMGKYQFSERVSAFGAVKYQTVSGSADVTVPLSAAAGGFVDGNTTISKASDVNFIVGAAYEIPKIALRVAASYESAAKFTPDVLLVNAGGFNTGAGEINTPDVFLLEFQTGIAANTLLFGSVRHAKWSDAQVYMSAPFLNAQLSDFDDSTTYNIGVGRKFSEKFSGSLSLTHAPSDCSGVSLLSPTCENNTVNIGGKYDIGNGAAISGGVSFRKYKTATSSASTGSIEFGGNTLMTVGMKLSKSF
jgi:long-subunit fatty acid transport protein